MAHDDTARREARRKFVGERLALPTIAISTGVPESTLRRWKREAREAGDDWDQARAAGLVSGDGFAGLISVVLEDFVTQFRATMELLKSDRDIPALERAKVMGSLADALNKTVNSAGRAAPKISELGVAWDVLKRLAEYVTVHHPSAAPSVLEVLEPFGDHLAEVYGDGK
ncbi:DUF1804 family protein [Xanthobacter sp. VTT E-85241]|uniref:DUF1804 family protein n=1 Tax=Roseixanthobacter finlandensis TaxID=3119922 RepID=UPI00372B9099